MKNFKLLTYILLPFIAFGLQSCGDENEDEPTVKEVFTAFDTTPIDGVPGSVEYEQISAAEFAKLIPCDIKKVTQEKTIFKGGSENHEYELTLYKWKNADFSIVTTSIKLYEVYSAELTSYTFTTGEYNLDLEGMPMMITVKNDGIYILNYYTHEEMNLLLPLDNCTRTYQVLADSPLRSYQDEESSTYSKPFSLVKLAEDHFYIENSDYTFEGYITAKGVNLTQIKPEEKEIGLLYR